MNNLDESNFKHNKNQRDKCKEIIGYMADPLDRRVKREQMLNYEARCILREGEKQQEAGRGKSYDQKQENNYEFNFLEESLNKNNPTEFGFNMLDKVFQTDNGIVQDSEKTLKLKKLRSEILNLRVSDNKLLPKVILKIAKLNSLSFLMKLQGFEYFCTHYCKKFGFELEVDTYAEPGERLSTARRHIKLVEDMIKDCFVNLEEMWKYLYFSHSSKMSFLQKLAVSNNFSEFFQQLNDELEKLIKLKEINKHCVELVDLRELLK